MNRAISEIESRLERLQSAFGNKHNDVTVRQLRAFLMIAKASIENEPLTTEDIRRLLNLSSQAAHKMVSQFVDTGFITKHVDLNDGRAKSLVLTDAGMKLAHFIRGGPEGATAFSEALSLRKIAGTGG